LIFAYALIVYITNMNILYFISIYNRFQSENKRENE